jgi:hypothetical protein
LASQKPATSAIRASQDKLPWKHARDITPASRGGANRKPNVIPPMLFSLDLFTAIPAFPAQCAIEAAKGSSRLSRS